MDQQPIEGSEPLPAPNPATAAAYLDELERVHARREERIDRRALAFVSLISAVVLSVYVAIACFAIGAGGANSSFLVILALFLLWIQLSTEFRESHGALGSPLSRSRPVTIGFVGVLLVVVIAAIAISAFGIDVPVLVRLIPALLALLIIGVPALRALSRSAPRETVIHRRLLTSPERLLTIGIAVLVSMSIWILGAGGFLLITTFALLVLIGYLAWWIAGRVSDRLPAVGAAWAWQQWMMFAVAGFAVAAVMIGQLLGFTETVRALAPVVAGVVLLLFGGSAFVAGRDV